MKNEKNKQQREIIQRILIGGVVLGAVATVLRMIITFWGVLAIPAVMGGGLSGQSSNELLANLVLFIGVVAPSVIGLGAVSTFLYLFISPDKESKKTLIGWGFFMMVYWIAIIFIPGL